MSTEYDLVIRGGVVATAADVFRADVGIRGERIVALGEDLAPGAEELDATGRLVLPGGVESHCHIEQESSMGGVSTADDFFSATRSAAFGGTTTVIPFAIQPRGASMREVVDRYRALGDAKALVDYTLHLTVTDATETVLRDELPGLIAEGNRSLKMYLAYDRMRVTDREMLEVLGVARAHGALPIVHAENWDMIRWTTDRLVEGGYTAPRYHAVSHPRLAEAEGIHRAIRMAELVDVPILIFHVSTAEGVEEIARARARGVKVHAETCPQYLFLTAGHLDLPGGEGAKFCCSPPLRDEGEQEALWRALADGTLDLVSSDHCPYSDDEHGKFVHGAEPTFRQVPNGLPGIELRQPLLFSAGVQGGRIDLQRFVALTATTPARMYGLYPRKGTIAIGADADVAIWDPERAARVTAAALHDEAGYTPYEGIDVRGWPVTVIRRGAVIVDDGELHAEPGSGTFVPAEVSSAMTPAGRIAPELDPVRNFGATLRV